LAGTVLAMTDRPARAGLSVSPYRKPRTEKEIKSMKLLLASQYEQLLANGAQTRARLEEGIDPGDHAPVVKLFTPDAACTWLLTELDPEEPDIAFGLCDLGVGCPEIGSVRLSELEALRGRAGLPVERDRFFRADRPLSAYAAEAAANGSITA